jgi:hypothetical protein
VASDVGQGSTFSIWLPLDDIARPPSEPGRVAPLNDAVDYRGLLRP